MWFLRSVDLYTRSVVGWSRFRFGGIFSSCTWLHTHGENSSVNGALSIAGHVWLQSIIQWDCCQRLGSLFQLCTYGGNEITWLKPFTGPLIWGDERYQIIMDYRYAHHWMSICTYVHVYIIYIYLDMYIYFFYIWICIYMYIYLDIDIDIGRGAWENRTNVNQPRKWCISIWKMFTFW